MPALDAARLREDVCAGRSSALLTPADRAVLAYVSKLTRTPAEMAEADVADLRAHGFDDRAIYDIVGIAGFFAYVTRITNGLGLPLESDWESLLPGTTPRKPAPPATPRP